MSTRKLQIRGKLILSFGFVMVILLSALGFITYITFADSLQSSKTQVARLNTEVARLQLTRVLTRYSNELSSLRYALPDGADQLTGWKGLLERYLFNHDEIESIKLLPGNDLEPIEVGWESVAPPLDRFDSIAPKTSAESPYYGDAKHLRLAYHKNLLWLAIQVPMSSDQENLILEVGLNSQSVIDGLMEQVAVEEATTVVVSFENQALFVLEGQEGARPEELVLKEILDSGKNDEMIRTDDYYAFSADLGILGWRLHYVIPEEEHVRDLLSLKNRVIAATIITLWISIWIVLIIAYRISLPLKKLSEATQRIHNMDYSKPVHVKDTGDEISELAKAFEAMRLKIKTLVSVDPLTQVFNRRHLLHTFKLTLSKASRTGEPTSCIMVDLDYFKLVNDTLGHQCGDKVLSLMGEILKQSVRDYDLPARYGGEEFCVLLPGTNDEQASVVAERIRTNLEAAEIEWEGVTFQVSASIGLATLPEPVKTRSPYTPEDLIDDADKALYEAKERGRNRVMINHRDERGFSQVAEPSRPAKPVTVTQDQAELTT